MLRRRILGKLSENDVAMSGRVATVEAKDCIAVDVKAGASTYSRRTDEVATVRLCHGQRRNFRQEYKYRTSFICTISRGV